MEGLAKVQFHINPGKLSPRTVRGVEIHFEHSIELGSDCFQDVSSAQLHGKMMDLDPDCCQVKLFKHCLKGNRPKVELQNTASDGPRTIPKESVLHLLCLTTNVVESIWKISHREGSKTLPCICHVQLFLFKRQRFAQKFGIY